jgi:hypothetical protein
MENNTTINVTLRNTSTSHISKYGFGEIPILNVKTKHFTEEHLKSCKAKVITPGFLRALKKVISYHLEVKKYNSGNRANFDTKAVAEETLEYIETIWTNCNPTKCKSSLGYFRLMIDQGIQKSLDLRSNTAKNATAYQIILSMDSKRINKTKRAEVLKSIRQGKFDSDKFISEISDIVSKTL